MIVCRGFDIISCQCLVSFAPEPFLPATSKSKTELYAKYEPIFLPNHEPNREPKREPKREPNHGANHVSKHVPIHKPNQSPNDAEKIQRQNG